MRILGIFAETDGLDLNRHKQALRKLSANATIVSNISNETLLQKIKRLVISEVLSLDYEPPKPEPLTTQKIIDTLSDDKGWSAILVAGHGRTIEADDFTGLITISEHEEMDIDKLKNALNIASNNGLQLLIFNCCDGTGLAKKALEFGVPRVIVFREIVPNEVAANFLERFIEQFKKTKKLSSALRNAKRQLDPSYPPPIFFQKDKIPELTWEMLDKPSLFDKIREKIKKWGLFFLVVFFLALGLRSIVPPTIKIQTPPTIDLVKKLPQAIQTFCYSKADSIVNAFLSCGEKSIFDSPVLNGDFVTKKRQGMEAFGKGDFDNAEKYLQETLTAIETTKETTKAKLTSSSTLKMLNDVRVETSIFLENAKILQKVSSKPDEIKNILLIAVALPGLDPEEGYYATSRYTIQAISYLQKTHNETNSKKVLILLANDTNNAGDGNKKDNDNIVDVFNVAEEIKNRNPYAIIGHYGSRITYYAMLRYNASNPKNIPVITFSSSATEGFNVRESLKIDESLSLKNKPNLYQIISTNEGMAKKLKSYFKNKSIETEKLFVFYRDGTLYSTSFVKELGYNPSKLNRLGKKLEEKQEIDKDLDNINNDPKNKAIFLCPDAFTQSPGEEIEINNTKRILQLQQQPKYPNLLVGACNVVNAYEDASKAKNLVIVVPWSKESDTSKQYFLRREGEKKEIILNEMLSKEYSQGQQLDKREQHEQSMRMALAYDSLYVTIEALSKLNNLPLKPGEYTQVHKELVSNTFYGITGEIKFQGNNNASKQRGDTSALLMPCFGPECSFKVLPDPSNNR
ncbi:CHAT domain-containing protein [Anabaena sp. FACHB-1237]|uniref:ABC transporter substrate-binding protein n=1 Tax=Anabaena sp. FACHB-1237 TaxID=2692769 RepID=UPI001681B473|nr:CHAT domain-containing protein [Anabaena sp. FACHB-1237]MBD2139358.1 CHAT domain-containing protein [Anabaena sp. FACHB-1237]